MRAFVVPASQSSLSQTAIQATCIAIAWVSLWRYGVSVSILTGSGITAVGFLAVSHWRASVKPRCALIIDEHGSFVAQAQRPGQEPTHDIQLVFALCSTNQILLRARVAIDGRSTRQEWRLKRTDNEALWRSACQWVQWLSARGETKKPQ